MRPHFSEEETEFWRSNWPNFLAAVVELGLQGQQTDKYIPSLQAQQLLVQVPWGYSERTVLLPWGPILIGSPAAESALSLPGL